MQSIQGIHFENISWALKCLHTEYVLNLPQCTSPPEARLLTDKTALLYISEVCVFLKGGMNENICSKYVCVSVFLILAASSFTFCRPAVEYRALPDDFKYQLSRCAGGNLTWHEGHSRKTAGGRTVKLLQQPGTEGPQVRTVSIEGSRVFTTCQLCSLSYCNLIFIKWVNGRKIHM